MTVNVPILICTEPNEPGNPNITSIRFNTEYHMNIDMVTIYKSNIRYNGIHWVGGDSHIYGGNLLIYDMELFENVIDSLIFNTDFLAKVKKLIRQTKLGDLLDSSNGLDHMI